ncbi:protein L-Myc-1b-like [Anguilla anguilla]|uniref:BHLH domain-containing protein n=1 Tax=Anguilla anguilla TaxID=7936 RepID=A0A9D3MWC4_ANGAN|nr:protein L-Myc-1b-like [Anguilla anguilla]KAG5856149.1 hypothetical protein ANANG_G00004950 [Anguilla anguilla]
MLGFSSNASRRDCWDTEHDRLQHYFYDGDDSEEDFYKSTAPSEDIWKKFELVPTPPMSPVRTPDGSASYPSPGDKLEWVSQFLGQDEEQEGQYRIDTKEIFGNLSSIINQDCMWSGFSASQRLEKVVNERLSGSAQTKTPLGVQASAHIGGRSQDSQVVGTLAADCVDPATVFTYPYSNSASCKKQASSGSESRTDSSDDEEIDVVTVESKQKKSRSSSATRGGRKPVTITVRADPHDPEMKHFHISIHQQQHNYAAPSPDSHVEADAHQQPPPTKRAKRQPCWPNQPAGSAPSPAERTAAISAPTANPALDTDCTRMADSAHITDSAHAASVDDDDSAPDSASHAPQTDSPQSSDSEDTDRRRTHNFLERKRRNDLRSRFLALRDQIPGLASSTKTPKVVILTRAVEHLRQLHGAARRGAQERRQLRARQRQLLRRLAELRRT